MSKLLISIKPKYVEEILLGHKKFEFRKTKCNRPVSSMFIYSTAPVKEIIAEVEILDIWIDTPAALWEKTSYAAGINKEEYDRYFNHCTHAVAYCLGRKNFLIPVYRLLPLGYHDLHNLIVMLINPSANKLKNKSTKPNGFVDLFFCLIKHKKSIR